MANEPKLFVNFTISHLKMSGYEFLRTSRRGVMLQDSQQFQYYMKKMHQWKWSFYSSWVPSLPKNATVWTVIKGFQKKESIARVTHAEYLRDIHQSHNSSRNKTQLERMRQLHNICSKWDESTVEEYLDPVNALI